MKKIIPIKKEIKVNPFLVPPNTQEYIRVANIKRIYTIDIDD